MIHLALWFASAIFLIGIGYVGLLLLRAVFISTQGNSRSPVPRVAKSLDIPVAAPAPKHTEPGTVSEAVAHALQQIRDAEKSEIARTLVVSEEAKRVLAATQSRQDAARTAVLDQALCWLYREVRNYPVWSKRDDADRWIKLPAQGPWEGGGDTDHSGRHQWIRLTLDDVRYEIHFKQFASYDYAGDKTFGTLDLRDPTGEVVLCVGISQRITAEYFDWRPASIDAYRPGAWAISLASLYSKARIADTQRQADARTGGSKIADLRGKFDIQ